MPSVNNKSDTDKKKAAMDAESRLHFISESTALTSQGLVLKHIDKIETIRTEMEARVVARLYSWPICRIIRRDFNMLCRRIFIRVISGTAEEKKIINDLIAEIMLQSELAKSEIRDNPELNAPLESEAQAVPLRLVSRETSFLYRALMNADESIAKLDRGFKERVINHEEYRMVFLPLANSYLDLKLFLMKKDIDASAKKATELGLSAGIL